VLQRQVRRWSEQRACAARCDRQDGTSCHALGQSIERGPGADLERAAKSYERGCNAGDP
jgi:hypothetical protein